MLLASAQRVPSFLPADVLAQSSSRTLDLYRSSWKLRTRKPHFARMAGLSVCIAIFLLIPCAVLTATDDAVKHNDVTTCDRSWGDVVLAVYVFIYAAIFLVFAFYMREIVDGFYIKEELV
jgi:hypothetical protein